MFDVKENIRNYVIKKIMDCHHISFERAVRLVTYSTFNMLLDTDPDSVYNKSIFFWVENIIEEAAQTVS